jgi:hypothetical protein
MHFTNEDLLSIKRKGDTKSRTLSRTFDTIETRNLQDIVGDDFFRVETSPVQSNCRSLRDLVVLESNCTEKDYFCCEEMTIVR